MGAHICKSRREVLSSQQRTLARRGPKTSVDSICSTEQKDNQPLPLQFQH